MGPLQRAVVRGPPGGPPDVERLRVRVRVRVRVEDQVPALILGWLAKVDDRVT